MKRTQTVGLLLLFTGCSSFDETAAKGYWKQSGFAFNVYSETQVSRVALDLIFADREFNYVFGDFSDFSETDGTMDNWRQNLWAECRLETTDFECSRMLETIHYNQWRAAFWEMVERLEFPNNSGNPTASCQGTDADPIWRRNDVFLRSNGLFINPTEVFIVSTFESNCDLLSAADYSPIAFEMTSTMTYQADSTADPHEVDDDGDGFTENTGDCDDSDAEINPDASELANYLDDDCDGLVDDETPGYDDDGDGYTDDGGDCDDDNAAVSPDATEAVNDIDDDCDGTVDEDTVVSDDDGDGFSENDGDCNDRDSTTYPGAATNDSATACMTDGDGDGYGSENGIEFKHTNCMHEQQSTATNLVEIEHGDGD